MIESYWVKLSEAERGPGHPQADGSRHLRHRGGARLGRPRLPVRLHLLPLRGPRRLRGSHHAFLSQRRHQCILGRVS